jgi:hypothetical protein
MIPNLIFKCLILCLIIIAVYCIYRRKKGLVVNQNEKVLWTGKIQETTKSFKTDYPLTTDSQYITYSMSIKINKWKHSQDVNNRSEILTHGYGNFELLGKKDVMSIALDALKNDLHFKINTQKTQKTQNTNTSCLLNTNGETSILSNDSKTIEEITLEYVPIGQFFHLIVVISKQRIDIYLNGLLHKTKVFKETRVDIDKGNPMLFFNGRTINGLISNFRCFSSELSIPDLKKIYNLDRINDNNGLKVIYPSNMINSSSQMYCDSSSS